MIKINVNSFKYLFIFIILLGIFLRSYNYWQFPESSETADELAWTWLGSSLISDAQPTSWSYFAAYKPNYIYNENIIDAPLVRPALDHPPLFSFIPGVAHLIATNGDWTKIPSAKVIRFPMLFISSLSLILFSFLSTKLFTKKWPLVATTIFALVPSFVFSSRLAISENFLALLAISITLTLHYLYQTKNTSIKRRLHLAVIIISAAAILTKVSGLVLPVAIITFALVKKDRKLFTSSLIGLLTGVILYLGYVYFYNWDLFIKIQSDQAARTIGLFTLNNRIFIYQNITKYIFSDGWIILGLFSFLTWFVNKNNDLPKSLEFVSIYLLISLGFIGTTVGQYTFHGWYDYTYYPFLVIFITYLFKRIYDSYSMGSIFIWLLLLPTFGNIFEISNLYIYKSHLYTRIFYFIGFIPFIGLILNNKKIIKITHLIGFILIISAGVYLVFNLNKSEFDIFQSRFFQNVKP